MATAYTYDDGAMREDLLDLITNIDPTETQLTSGLGVSKADQIRHEWLVDTLDTVGTNAYVEGVDASYRTLTNPTRLANYTQIIRKGYQVSDTERAVNTAGFEDRFDYEKAKAMKALKNDLELAVLRGSLASGTGSAARQMEGVKRCLSLVTSQSGVSMSETIFNDYLSNVWTATNKQVDEVYGGMYMKRKISGFTAGSTKNVNAQDKRLINSVDVYEADAASLVKLFAHKYVTISGDTNYDIVGIVSELFKIAYLRRPFSEERAKTGDATKGEIVTEATLECLHYNGGFWAQKHL